jgi:cytidylate kinase
VAARGEPADYGAVLASVRRRDEIDSGRAHAPLRAADDAIVIDTTPLDIEQVLERVLALVNGWGNPNRSL